MFSAAFFNGCSEDPALSAYDRAEKALSEGDYAGALEKYSYVANNFHSSPYGPKSRYRIGFIYNRHLRENEKALEAYKTLYYLYPESSEAVLARQEIAKLYSRGGEHSRAVGEYQRLLEERPGEADKFLYQIAMEYIKMNDFRQARIELTELLSRTSNRNLIPKIHYQIANTYYIEGDLFRAVTAYDEVISRFPESQFSIEAGFGKGKAFEESGKLKEALQAYKSIENEYPDREVLKNRINLIESGLGNEAGRGM